MLFLEAVGFPEPTIDRAMSAAAQRGNGRPGAFSEAAEHCHKPGLKLLCCGPQSEVHFIS